MTKQEREKLIEQYAAGPARLKAALAAVPKAALQWRPKPGEWSAHEIVVHCADSETNSFVRIRFLAAEKEPVLNEAQAAKQPRQHVGGEGAPTISGSKSQTKL